MTSISFRNALLGGALLAAAAVSMAPAYAAPISHTTDWNAGGGIKQSFTFGTLLSNATNLTQGTDQLIGTLIGPAGTVGDAITFSPNTFTSLPATSFGSVGSLIATWGASYSFTSASGHFQRNPDVDSISLLFTGTFNDSNGIYATQTATLSESFTQAGDGAPVGFSASFATPPTVRTPEPATMAILGAGFLGLAAVRRRKS